MHPSMYGIELLLLSIGHYMVIKVLSMQLDCRVGK